MALDFPEEIILKKNRKIIDGALKTKAHLQIKQFSLDEDFKSNSSCIKCLLNFRYKRSKNIKISSKGNGVIDALFSAILKQFSNDYVSLQNVKLYDFLVYVDIKKSLRTTQTDAPVEIKIVLEGMTQNKIYFKAESNSLVKAGIKAVCNAVEYLINAELAVIQLHKDIMYARKRNRVDLENIYTSQLHELIKFISYSQVIDNLQKKN